MNILITAGGTSEPIDEVRSITNTSTGKLGTVIYNELLERCSRIKGLTIHYIHSKTAVKPVNSPFLKTYEVTDTASVLDAVSQVLQLEEIHWMIHLMAVSDYYVSEVREAGSDEKLDRNKKISSKNELHLILKPTPKIIKAVKQLSPNTNLIGFKLLNNVSEEELIKVATRQQNDNNCTFVVANDLKDVGLNRHHAIMVDQGKVIGRGTTKEEVAKVIVRIMLEGLQ